MGCRPPARASVAQTSSTTGYPPPHYSAYTQQAYSVLRLKTRADSSCQRTRLKSVSSHYSQMVLQQSSAQPGIYSQLSMERILPTCGSVQRTAQTTGNRSLDRLTSAIGFCFFPRMFRRCACIALARDARRWTGTFANPARPRRGDRVRRRTFITLLGGAAATLARDEVIE